MNDEKVLAFSIRVDGVSNEANEIAKLTIQLKNLKAERNELIKQASSPGHIASNEELQKLAAYNREIGVQDAALKTLKRTVDSASDSLARKKAVLIELTEKSNKASSSIAQEMAPAINKLNQEIKNGEEARGVFTRNVGNYPQLFSSLPGPIGQFTQSLQAATSASDKGGISFKQAFAQLAAGGAIIATLGALFIGIKDAIMSTTFGIDLMNKVSAVSKQLFYDLSMNGLQIYTNKLKEAVEIQGRFNELRLEEYKNGYEISKIEKDLQEQRLLASDQTLELDVRLTALNKVRDDENKESSIKVGWLKAELKATTDLMELRPEDEKLAAKAWELATRINDTYAEADRSMKRVESTRTGYIKKEVDDRKKEYDDLMKLADEEIKLNEEAEKKKTEVVKEELNKQIKLKQDVALDEEPDLVKRAQLQAAFDRDNLLRATKNADEQKLIWEKYYADVEKISEDSTKKRLDKEWEEGVKEGKKMFDENQKAAKENNDASLRADKIRLETEDMVLKDMLARGKISNKEYLKAKMIDDIAFAKNTIHNAEEQAAKIEQIQKKYEIDERNRKIKLEKDISNAVLAGAQSGADAIFSAKKDQLNAAMNAELTNTNLTEAQKSEIKKKYARLQQQQDVKQAIINGAIAITKTFADYGFTPAAWIAGALMAVQTAIQVAVIRAQKFAHSGKVRTGVSVPADRNGDNTLVLAKTGEVILNERHQAMLGGAKTFKEIGVPGFASSGIVGQITPRMPMGSGIMNNFKFPGYAGSGYIGARTPQVMPFHSFNRGADATEIANLLNTLRVELNVNELNKAQNEVRVINKVNKL